jgi:hypothetical protein
MEFGAAAYQKLVKRWGESINVAADYRGKVNYLFL